MDDARQIQLFKEDAGEISPPEERLYLGTSGWSYADWEGTVYPPGIAPAGRLAEYVKHFATVEIDSTFYGTPRRSTVERWRRISCPKGFSSLPSSLRVAEGETFPHPDPRDPYALVGSFKLFARSGKLWDT